MNCKIISFHLPLFHTNKDYKKVEYCSNQEKYYASKKNILKL